MKNFFLFCLVLLFYKEVLLQKTQEELDSKLTGLVRELKMIFLRTSCVMQGQTICLISAFTSEMLSLGLNSCWSEVEISSFLYQCSAFLAVALFDGELQFFLFRKQCKVFVFLQKYMSSRMDLAGFFFPNHRFLLQWFVFAFLCLPFFPF